MAAHESLKLLVLVRIQEGQPIQRKKNKMTDILEELVSEDIKILRCGFFETYVIRTPEVNKIKDLKERRQKLLDLLRPIVTLIPIIRRIVPTVIANEIVGVQPMTGSIGQINTLRVRYGSSKEDEE